MEVYEESQVSNERRVVRLAKSDVNLRKHLLPFPSHLHAQLQKHIFEVCPMAFVSCLPTTMYIIGEHFSCLMVGWATEEVFNEEENVCDALFYGLMPLMIITVAIA